MTDEQLIANVRDELAWDPKIDAEDVAVAAQQGVVTLRGTVGGFRAKSEAGRAAQRVRGVREVHNEITVRLSAGRHWDDAELRGDVLQALLLDTAIPDSVDATVSHNVVTLSGVCEHPYQRDEAAFVAGNVVGVLDVVNHIALTDPRPDPGDVMETMTEVFAPESRPGS
jgi:osmotically-inducible protein OsmY